MKQQELNNLIDKVNRGIATEEELGVYNYYMNQLTAVDEVWDVQHLGPEEHVKAELLGRVEMLRRVTGLRALKLWPRVRIAAGIAAAVATVVFGVWFFAGESGMLKHVQDVVVLNDITPGKNGATITLADGKVIQLSAAKTGVVIGNNKFAYHDGTGLRGVEGNKNSGLLTASTAKSQTYQFTLPDGSKVWLNADSRISFAPQFSEKIRKILLSGEAYFEVSKEKNRPFVVESNGQQVTVLGTHFNINAYRDEVNTTTTLLEGSVRINSSAFDAPTILKPNQQSILSPSSINVNDVDAVNAIAWKNGLFSFRDTPLEIVMLQISRWYDVDVVYASAELKSEPFSGSVSRYDKVSKILHMIAYTGVVKFKLEGRKLTVYK